MALPGITAHGMDLPHYFPVAFAGIGRHTISFPIDLVAMQALAVLVLNYNFGFRGRILSTRWVTTLAGSAGDDATLVPTLDTIALLSNAPAGSGGQLGLTTALTPAGSVVDGLTITGGNTFTEHTNFSVTCTVATSAFTAGRGVLEVRVENLDEVEALAALGILASD